MRIGLNNAFRVSGNAVGRPGKVDPFSKFKYDIDFKAGTAKGGLQPYGNNTQDGRLFRDPNNVTASFLPDATGTFVAIASSGLRRTTAGHFGYPSSGTSVIKQNRDLTQTSVWTASNVTALKNQTGITGVANSASSITATATNGTILQAVTLASSNMVFSVDVKRLVGTGTLEMTVDNGTTWTVITGITTAFQQKYIYQAAVTNPTFGFRIGTSGDSFAVDFCMHTVPSNSINIPPQYRYATTSATVFTSQSRPNAAVGDSSPLITVAQGAFGFYWQGRSERATGCFVITGSTNVFCSVQSTGAGGAIQFSDGPGVSKTADGAWRVGLSNLNKVAGYVTAGGAIKVACNGLLGSAGTGATLETALDHFDLGTNGAGQNSIYGINERFAMGTGISFTDAELIAMTT